MSEPETNGPWWTKPAITTAVAIFLGGQLLAGVIWGTRLDSRVGSEEVRVSVIETRLSKSDDAFRKIDIIEERQRQEQSLRELSAKTIDQMRDTINQLRDETLRVRPLPPNAPEPFQRRR